MAAAAGAGAVIDPARLALAGAVVAALEGPLELDEVVLDGETTEGVPSLATATQELKDYLKTTPTLLCEVASAAQTTGKHMAAHRKDTMVQSLGCAVLMKLGLVEESDIRAALLAGDAPHAVLGAMQAHPRERGVQYYALASIVNLGGHEDGLSTMLGASGLTTAVVAALEQFFEDKEIQLVGAWAVLSLSVCRQNRDLLSQTTVAGSLVNALRNFESELEVQLYAIKAISNLSVSSSTKFQLGELGAIPLVLRALESLSQERDVVHASATAVRNLALSEKNKTELRGAGAVELLTRVQAQYVTDSLVTDSLQKAQKALQAPPPQACCRLS